MASYDHGLQHAGLSTLLTVFLEPYLPWLFTYKAAYTLVPAMLCVGQCGDKLHKALVLPLEYKSIGHCS